MRILRSLRGERKDFFAALLLFFCSMCLFSSHLYILAFLYILYISRGSFNWKQEKVSYCIVVLIVFFSFFNQLIYLLVNGNIPSLIQLIPYSALIIITMAAAHAVNTKVLKWFLLFVCLDVFVGVYEVSLGINSIFGNIGTQTVDTNLFYDKTVFGLNGNSSGLAEKILLAIMVYYRYPETRIFDKRIFYPIMIIGLIISFNRSAIIATIVFALLVNFNSIKKVLLFTLVLCVVFILFPPSSDLTDLIISQFARGGDSIFDSGASSERDFIYPYYWNFIKENPILGNGSFKLLVDMHDGRILHAHNSYLQTMATNGLPIAFLYFLLVFRKINRQNFKFILPLLVCSLFQTTIFWGVSLADFFLYLFLFRPSTPNYFYTAPQPRNRGYVISG